MTATDWDVSTDPEAMLQFLQTGYRRVDDEQVGDAPPRPSDRKLRLLACACCRAIWEQLTDPRSRHAVETAERYADGAATDEELAAARTAAWNAVGREAWDSAFDGAWSAVGAAVQLPIRAATWSATEGIQCHILRDLFAPFRPVLLKYGCNFCGGCGEVEADLEYHPAGGAILCPESYDEDGRYIGCEKRENWLTPTVLELARAAYASGNPLDSAALAVLADALEEAGCTDEDTLQHCRGFVLEEESTHDGKMHWIQRFTPHYRGCHCLDALLNLE